LHFAARAGQAPIVSRLLEAGADITVVGGNGTARDIAFKNNYIEVVMLLDNFAGKATSPPAYLPKKSLPIPPQSQSQSQESKRRSDTNPGFSSFSPSNSFTLSPVTPQERPLSEKVTSQTLQEIQTMMRSSSYSMKAPLPDPHSSMTFSPPPYGANMSTYLNNHHMGSPPPMSYLGNRMSPPVSQQFGSPLASGSSGSSSASSSSSSSSDSSSSKRPPSMDNSEFLQRKSRLSFF